MDIDERIRDAFAREVDAAPRRPAGAGETVRALARDEAFPAREPTRAAARRAGYAELASLAALAAAALAVATPPAGRMAGLRPLAVELTALAADAGAERVLDLVAAAGESFRSFKRR